MLTRTQTGWQRIRTAVGDSPKITFAMRAVMNWATLEEHDKVLDLNCGDGDMLSCLSDKLRLIPCGICQNAEQSRAVRDRMGEADIVYARPDDIPWRDGAFDAVLSAEPLPPKRADAILKETIRVLRPGGQAVVITPLIAKHSQEGVADRRLLLRAMQAAGFDSVSWRRAIFCGVAVGWKKRGERDK